MEKITRQFQELTSDERRVYETLLGHELRENQQVILHVITLEEPVQQQAREKQAIAALPEWCNVYDGLSDEEIEELEKVILDRSHWSRSSQ